MFKLENGAIYKIIENININTIKLNKGCEFLITKIKDDVFTFNLYSDSDFNDGIEFTISKKHVNNFTNKVRFIEFY